MQMKVVWDLEFIIKFVLNILEIEISLFWLAISKFRGQKKREVSLRVKKSNIFITIFIKKRFRFKDLKKWKKQKARLKKW